MRLSQHSSKINHADTVKEFEIGNSIVSTLHCTCSDLDNVVSFIKWLSYMQMIEICKILFSQKLVNLGIQIGQLYVKNVNTGIMYYYIGKYQQIEKNSIFLRLFIKNKTKRMDHKNAILCNFIIDINTQTDANIQSMISESLNFRP